MNINRRIRENLERMYRTQYGTGGKGRPSAEIVASARAYANSEMNKSRAIYEETGMLPSGRKIRSASIKQLETASGEAKKQIAKKIFESVAREGDNPSKELFEAKNDEDNALMSFLPQSIRAQFKNEWKELAAKQVFNGSFLEFQGMRFADGRVFDAERNDANEGKNVLAHILEPSSDERIYLKCRFSLANLGKDDEFVNGRDGKRWKDLTGKGVNSVEPDVIVRVGNEIRIFELKMGLGKPETTTNPHECHQLMRCKRLFDNWIAEGVFNLQSLPVIKLYFVGWSAPTDKAVVFAPSPLQTPKYHVTKMNSTGMAKLTSINAQLVSAIILELDRKRLKAFNSTVDKFIKPWGPYYESYKQQFQARKQFINSLKSKYRVAINAPPLPVQVSGAKNARSGVEQALRNRARKVVNEGNSESESLSPETRTRRIKYNMTKFGVPENIVTSVMMDINRSKKAAVKRARTVAEQDPEILRLQAELRAVSSARSNNLTGFNNGQEAR